MRDTPATPSNRDLQLAFDVGHSSLGWAVLQTPPDQSPALLGCGAVIFPSNDCLTSKRRDFRRQRRHIRATRLRLARLRRLLAQLGVLTADELEANKCAWPWLLAARVLRGGKKLTWSELWAVLRWYAHNRGYDGNKGWSRQEADDAAEKDDAEKVQNARALYEEYGTDTMAETWCAICDLDPLGTKKSVALAGDKRPKARNAAFPREDIEREVETILRAHFGQLPCADEALLVALMRDWKAIPCPDIQLPARFHGGLLFGQLHPRFDNRIIGRCPISGEKIPSRHCREFLDFRWTEMLAKLQIAKPGETEIHTLSVEDRLIFDRRARELGFFRYEKDKLDKKTGTTKRGTNELRDELTRLTGCDRDNLDGVLFDANMREALKVLPVIGDSEAFRIAWAAFDGPSHDAATGAYLEDRIRGRFITQLLRGKKESPRPLTIASILAELDTMGERDVAERLRLGLRAAATNKGRFNDKKHEKLSSAQFSLERLSGRARFGRKVMRQALHDFMRRDNSLHPLEKGGCMERTKEILDAERGRALDEQSNNHLVRHRLRVLAGDPDAKPRPFRGLLDDLLATYAGGEPARVARITVEVARDLQEMSGKDSKKKSAAHNQKLDTHEQAATALADAMRAEGIPFIEADGRPRLNGALIRKARIALDLQATDPTGKCKTLSFRCPYTGRVHCLADVVRGKLELDHIVPRSKRLSDALEAMVLTSPRINREKKNRTALEFVRAMNEPQNRALREEMGVMTEAQYLEFVNSLWPKSDPFRRSRAGGERPTDDERRCWRRREMLLLPKWEKQEFTPADLAKTRQLIKVAVQRLEARFTEAHRPPIIVVPGAVTKSFRDRAWKLLPLLRDRADTDNQTTINAVFAEWKTELQAGREYNLKEHLRGVTHLHHALDAATIALVTEFTVPAAHRSFDGRLAQLLVKRKLNPEERAEFTGLVQRFRLPQFFRWGKENELWIDDLPAPLKEQLHRCLAERRVVQHIPAETAGLHAELNAWRVIGVKDGIAQLRQRLRQPDGTRPRKPDAYEKTAKVIGLRPGKLADLKAALVISDNYGLALDPVPEIIPFHKVWNRLRELREKNGGKPVRVLRNGMLVRLKNTQPAGLRDGIWRIYTVQGTLKIDFVAPDQYGRPKKGPTVWREVSLASLGAGNIEVLARTLVGHPTPSRPLISLNRSENTANFMQSGLAPQEGQQK